MRRRTGKVSRWELLVLAGIAVGLFTVLSQSARSDKARDYQLKYDAARTCQQAFAALKKERLKLGLPIDEINDPNKTGLIGSQYSLITVGRGDLNGVMTATNPNFVAVVLTVLKKAGLRRGDAVAVGITGSTPALNIEVLSACQALGLKPAVITALSSGMWGANDPRFTWLDMERRLIRDSILPFRSIAASLGGEGDDGRGLSPIGREWLDSAIVRNGIPRIEPVTVADAVSERMSFYRKALGQSPIRAFINVGNGVANTGEAAHAWPSGVVDRRPSELPQPSVARAMVEQGAKLINFSDVARLAYRYKFPVAPIPLPQLARGRMFIEKRYPVGLAAVFAGVIVALLLAMIEIDLDYYVRRRKRSATEAVREKVAMEDAEKQKDERTKG